ncbi:hypothetical protein D9M72_511470 [compost metagenome]
MRRVGALQGDLRQVAGIRLGVHRAVAVDHHLFRQQHQIDGGGDAVTGGRFDQLQRRADGVGGGVDGAGHQAVHLIQRQHHGAEHDVVFQLGGGHRCVQALVLAQVHHGLHVAFADPVRIEDFQAFGQFDAVGAGHRVHIFRPGQQHTMGDASGLAGGGCLHGARLAAFGQDDALAGELRLLDQTMAEGRRRQALARAGGATTGAQPVEVEIACDEFRDLLRALAVVHRDFLVHPVQVGRRVVGAGGHAQYRQAALQGATA